MLPLLLLAVPAAAQFTPPANDSAVEPYWPHYPTDRSADDFTMNGNSSAADLAGTSDLAQWIISASNVFRAQFGSQPVTWNASCANEANVHAQSCLWEHWGSDNLASLSSSDWEARFDLNPMIEMWAQEWDYYPFRHPEAEAYSHFTAMVWNESMTVGCAWNVDCPDNPEVFPSRTYFVCNYWPPGNIGTNPPGKEYHANVGNFTKWTSPEQVPDPAFNAAEHGAGAPSVNVTINGTSVQTITAQTTGAVSPGHNSGAAALGVSAAMLAMGLGAALVI